MIRWRNSILLNLIFFCSFMGTFYVLYRHANQPIPFLGRTGLLLMFILCLSLAEIMFCIMGIAYIDNDLEDLLIDRVVHDDRPIASGVIAIWEAIEARNWLIKQLVMSVIFAGIVLCLQEYPTELFLCTIAGVFLLMLLLWLYNHGLRKTLMANLVIALCTTCSLYFLYLLLIPGFVTLSGTLLGDSARLVPIGQILMTQTFGFTIGLGILCYLREFLKDCLDYRGDRGLRTTVPLLLMNHSERFETFVRSRYGQRICWYLSSGLKILMGISVLLFNLWILWSLLL